MMDVRDLIKELLQYDLDDDVEIKMITDNGADITPVEGVGRIGRTVYIEIDMKGYDL